MEQTIHFDNVKLCPLCNKMNKFKIIIDKKTKLQKTSGKKCIACTSSKNNLRLKSLNYYANYYQQNSTALKLKDKERYQQKKNKSNNIVSFNIVE
jgi:transcription elongation factor Elf1